MQTSNKKVAWCLQWKVSGSVYDSEKLPTYPPPNQQFCPKREVSVNVGLWAACICLFYRLVLLISFLDLLILGHNTHMLRLIKSEAEIKLLRQSASLTAKAFKKVRKMPLHRNPVLCLFVCAQGGVMWGWGSVGHTRSTKSLSKGGKETWISTFIPAYYSEGTFSKPPINIIPRARMGSESITHEAKGRMGY